MKTSHNSISQTSVGIIVSNMILILSSASQMVLLETTASCSQTTPEVAIWVKLLQNNCTGQKLQEFLMLKSQIGLNNKELSLCTMVKIQMIAILMTAPLYWPEINLKWDFLLVIISLLLLLLLIQKSCLNILSSMNSDTALQRISGLLRLRDLNILSTKAFMISVP